MAGIAKFVVREVTKRGEHGDLMWIAHSFGGPLLKGILSIDQGVVGRTRGVLLFGVPRDGGSWEDMALATAGKNELGLSEDMKKLQREVKWLGETERVFEELCEERRFRAWWFLENSGEIDGGIVDAVSISGGISTR